MDKNVRNICLGAFTVRLLVLSIIVLFSDQLSSGFMSSDIINDDVRYLTGAEIFAKNGKSIFDFSALGDAFMQIGVWQVAEGYEFALWYWIVSELMFIFQTHIAVRIINIIFAVLSVKCIYEISSKLYGINSARIASKLYAFLPYPVFFSCFLYKDQFYTLIILLIFRIIVINGSSLKIKHIISLFVLILLSSFIRSGLSVIILICIMYLYIKNNNIRIDLKKICFFIPVIIVCLLFFVNYSLYSLIMKYESYVIDFDNVGNTIPFLTIKSLLDIYRYPFSYSFIMLLPAAGSFSSLKSWLDITCAFNVVVLPIALGNFLYLLNLTLKKESFFWAIQILYLITIVTSLGIFRHSYYLQPYMMIFFSHFYLSLKNKKLYKELSFLLILSSFVLLSILY